MNELQTTTVQDVAKSLVSDSPVVDTEGGLVVDLFSTLDRENAKKVKRWFFFFGATILLLILGMWKIKVGVFSNFSWWLPALIATAFAATPLQRRTTRKLAELNDIRAVGPLADALDKQDKPTKKVALEALVRLVPNLTEADGELLTANQREHLWSAVWEGYPELSANIVHAMTMFGDDKAVEYAEKLAKGDGLNKKAQAVKLLAQEMLPQIRAAAERNRDKFTLLRPSHQPSEANVLLRPASGAGSEETDTLLRPVESDKNGLGSE